MKTNHDDSQSGYLILKDFSCYDTNPLPIFAADITNDRIVYVNPVMKALLKGKVPPHCYEIVNKNGRSCVGCYFKNPNHLPTSLASWEYMSTAFQKSFRVSVILAKTKEGVSRLHFFRTLEAIESSKDNSLPYPEREAVLAQISRHMLKEKDTEKALSDSLLSFRKAIGAKGAHFFLIERKNKKKTLYRAGTDSSPFPYSVLSPLAPYLKEARPVLFEQMGSSKSEIICYEKILGKKAKNFLLVPVFFESRLFGFLTAETFSTAKLGELSSFLQSVSGYIGLGLEKRGLLDILNKDPVTGVMLLRSFQESFPGVLRKNFRPLNTYFVVLNLHGFVSFQAFFGEKRAARCLKETASYLSALPSLLLLGKSKDIPTFYMLLSGDKGTIEKELVGIGQLLDVTYPEVSLAPCTGIYPVPEKRTTYAEGKNKSEYALNYAIAHHSSSQDYGLELVEKEKEKAAIIAAFPSSLAANEFVPYIQPKYNIQDQSYSGGEVLCRWNRNGKMVSPGVFIPIFEENGQIRLLDRYMLIETCKVLRRELDSGMSPVPLSFNYSRIDFLDQELFDKTLSIIDHYQIPHQLIQIEITESSYISEKDRILDFADKSIKAGIAILMDDFGSGYSSLNSLKEMDISGLKLDYAFLRNFDKATGDKNRRIIEGTIDIARSLDISIIVEGVETVKEVKYFDQMGVKYIQGYFFGKPMPVAEFEKVLSEKHQVFDIHVSHDPLLSELRNPTTSANFLFQNSNTPRALIKVINGSVVLELGNAAFNALHFVNQNEMTPLPILLERLGLANQKEEILALFSSAPGTESYNSSMKITLARDNVPPIVAKIGVNTLFREKGFSYYLIQLDFAENKYTLSSDFSVLPLETLALLTEDSPIGVFAFDQDDNIHYVNKKMQEFVPDCRKGASIHELFGEWANGTLSPFSVHRKSQICYLPRLGCNVFLYSIGMKSGANPMTIVHFCPSNLFLQSSEGPLTTSERIASSLKGVADIYTEINLATGQYRQIHITNDLLNGIPAVGQYEDLYSVAKDSLSGNESANVKGDLNLQSLREKAESGEKYFTAEYQLKGDKKWCRILGTVLKQSDADYATLFVIDNTVAHLRETDLVSGSYSKTWGKLYMDDYLLSHAGVVVGYGLLEIANLKEINEKYGHKMGDIVLSEVGKAMMLFPHDRILYPTRMCGDDFAFLLLKKKDQSRKELSSLLIPKCQAIEKKLGLSTSLDARIALVFFQKDGDNSEALYEAADGLLCGSEK